VIPLRSDGGGSHTRRPGGGLSRVDMRSTGVVRGHLWRARDWVDPVGSADARSDSRMGASGSLRWSGARVIGRMAVGGRSLSDCRLVVVDSPSGPL